MTYPALVSRYISVTKEIGFLEQQLKKEPTDIAVKEKLKTLRKEQKQLEEEINNCNKEEIL